jgi:Triose-phosphate Transporter family
MIICCVASMTTGGKMSQMLSYIEPSVLSSLAGNTHFVGAAWMITSSLFTTYSTTKFLKYDSSKETSSFPSYLDRPTLLTLYRFGGSLILGLLLHPNLRILERVRESVAILPDFALPATFLFIANFANSISLNRIGISLTYTSKCAIPLITVLLTLFMDGMHSLPNFISLFSLIPIAAGIASASWNSPMFEAFGFFAAMVSCTAQSMLNVTSKRAISKSGVSGSQAQRAMVIVGFAISIIMSLIQAHESKSDLKKTQPPIWLTSTAAISYHLEYCLSFMFVRLVNPITYGACDAIRRLCIIISGRCMFGGAPFSRLNKVGILFALFGALSYSIASNI